MTTQTQNTQAMPWLGPRKSFAYLPQSQQLAVFALIGLLLLFLWPGLLDPIRMGNATSVKQGLKPKLPTTGAQFGQRLAEHYSFAWLLQQPGSPQARTRREVQLALSVAQLAVVALGAIAGCAVRSTKKATLAPLRFGEAGKVRARAAVMAREEEA